MIQVSMSRSHRRRAKRPKTFASAAAGIAAAVTACLGSPPSAQAQAAAQKPNILFIMGYDIGWMQPGIYHEGLGLGETPNIDRIGHEGAKFLDYVGMQSCTSGRNAFFTGMYPLRTGLIPPELPGSPAYLRPGTPALAEASQIQNFRIRMSSFIFSSFIRSTYPQQFG